jgi:hypothetical protein
MALVGTGKSISPVSGTQPQDLVSNHHYGSSKNKRFTILLITSLSGINLSVRKICYTQPMVHDLDDQD